MPISRCQVHVLHTLISIELSPSQNLNRCTSACHSISPMSHCPFLPFHQEPKISHKGIRAKISLSVASRLRLCAAAPAIFTSTSSLKHGILFPFRSSPDSAPSWAGSGIRNVPCPLISVSKLCVSDVWKSSSCLSISFFPDNRGSRLSGSHYRGYRAWQRGFVCSASFQKECWMAFGSALTDSCAGVEAGNATVLNILKIQSKPSGLVLLPAIYSRALRNELS